MHFASGLLEPGKRCVIARDALHLRRRLPHRLDVLLQQLPLHPCIRHLSRQSRLRDLLHEPQRTHLTLPVADVLGLDLDQRHARVVGGAVVDAIAEVAEPGGGALGVEVLDAGVRVGGRGGGAGDGDPVLRGGVLEGDLGGLVVVEVGELVGVLVG